MNAKEYARERLEQSSKEAGKLWKRIKEMLPRESDRITDTTKVIDIQDISDDCIDLIMSRKCDETGLEKMEHWRFVAEKKFFKKPKITMHITSGPTVEEFMSNE